MDMPVVPESSAAKIANPVTVAACLIADGDACVSRAVDQLTVDFAGISGDYHAGLTRKSASREPCYPRGTEIRNDRRVTIVSPDELGEPAWIGANLVLSGLPDLFPPAENARCKVAGVSVGEFAQRDGVDLLFPKVARHKRGLVASDGKPGMIATGEAVKVRRPRRAK